ncbi:hypothetical protein STHU_11390 [Allostella humosa]|nr:hypothetical protein STHU_11390 [Stella humosa]
MLVSGATVWTVVVITSLARIMLLLGQSPPAVTNGRLQRTAKHSTGGEWPP